MTAAGALATAPPLPQDPTTPRTIRVRPAPVRQPPFDDELFWAGAGPLDQPLPFPLPPRHRPPLPPLHTPGLPDPARWCHTLLVGLREVAAGHRPVNQLSPLLAPGVAAGLGGELNRIARAHRRHWTFAAQVRSVHASEPADGVAEVCATLQVGERLRAVAMRLEARHGRWWCTRLQLG